jgi:hypothetical protein
VRSVRMLNVVLKKRVDKIATKKLSKDVYCQLGGDSQDSILKDSIEEIKSSIYIQCNHRPANN